ncbi:unnamed protein product [Brassica oleracea]
MSSHKCYTKSNQISSGFVITNASSQVSVRGVSLCFNISFSEREVLYRSNRCTHLRAKKSHRAYWNSSPAL